MLLVSVEPFSWGFPPDPPVSLRSGSTLYFVGLRAKRGRGLGGTPRKDAEPILGLVNVTMCMPVEEAPIQCVQLCGSW